MGRSHRWLVGMAAALALASWAAAWQGMRGVRPLASVRVADGMARPSPAVLHERGARAQGGVRTAAASLAIPVTRPRLWYAAQPGAPGTTRLQRARAWQAAGNPVPIPSASGSPSAHYRARALRSLLAGHVDATDCDAAVGWLRGFTLDTSQVSSDAARWYGEDAILVYDWCHHRLSAADRSLLIARWNGYVATLNAKPWGGPSMPSNNYFWGYLRNSLLWGIATAHENDQADGFIQNALSLRYRDPSDPSGATVSAFSRWFDAFGTGGVTLEGSQYGPYVLAYATIAFTAAADYGYDAWAALPYWRQAVYALQYSTTPASTLTRDGGVAGYDTFPFNDDEFFREGRSAQRSAYADLLGIVALRWPDDAAARVARDWLARVPAPMSWWVRAEFASTPDAAPAATLPLDYYAAGARFLFTARDATPQSLRALFQLGGTDGFSSTPARQFAGGGVGHSHLDAGSFQLWRGGRWLSRETTGYAAGDSVVGWNGGPLVDPLEAVAHNTVLFEGRGAIGQYVGPPQVLRLESAPAFAYAAVDLTPAYRFPIAASWDARYDWPYAERVVREFVHVRDFDAVVVLDRLTSGSDSLHPWYTDERFRGPRIAGHQVRKTFVVHAGGSSGNGANPWTQAASRATATVGTQALDVISLLPATPARRVIAEGGPVGQYRIEIDTSGSDESTFLHVLGARDASAAPLQAQLQETSTEWLVTLVRADGSSAVLRLQRGATSQGGTIRIGMGPERPLGSGVQPMLFAASGLRWDTPPGHWDNPIAVNGGRPLVPPSEIPAGAVAASSSKPSPAMSTLVPASPRARRPARIRSERLR